MQNYNDMLINERPVFDMATTAKAVGEFSGRPEDDTRGWVKRIDTLANLSRIDDNGKVKLAAICFRGAAAEWGIGKIADNPAITWKELAECIVARFESQKTADEILSRFLARKEASDYNSFTLMLEEAGAIKAKQGIDATHLMRQVISRSPAGIKSILLQCLFAEDTWEIFLGTAEKAAWVAFPEKVIGRVSNDYDNKTAANQSKIWYCPYHGEGEHSAKYCPVIKKLESKGWMRKQPSSQRRFVRDIRYEDAENGSENQLNKDSSIYLCNNIKNHSSCFLKEAKLGKDTIKVLLDTGADVSLIPEKLTTKYKDQIKSCSAKLKSVCGENIEVAGKLSPQVIDIDGNKIEAEPIVTINGPGDYMILGADSLQDNPSIGLKILEGCLFKERKMTRQNKIRMIYEDKAPEIFEKLFKTELDEFTKSKIGVHSIETQGQGPVTQRNLQIPKFWENEIDKTVKKLKQAGIIRDSMSPWASSIIPVKKKDGEIRLCIDFRGLNNITKKDCYPIPRIDEILDELSGANYFTCLDATSGYYQIEIVEADKEKTAFRWKGGLYEFNRMPFGLCNAPATFQRAMDVVFNNIRGVFVLPYLDDIIIYSKTAEDHINHLKIIAERLLQANIALNKKKCKFFKTELEILGNIVSGNSVKPAKSKVEAINNYRRPNNIKELRSYLGLLNYCRQFIPNLSEVVEPLNGLLKGETKRSSKKIVWTDPTIKSFKDSRHLLSEKTLRTQPNFSKEFILTTDASETAIGAILSQEDCEGNEAMISSYSKTLDSAQRNYSVTDKELLAAVKSMEHYRRYLLGKKFTLKTDHRALESMKTAKNPTSRLLRWTLKLQEFDYDVKYIAGEMNGADGLSRDIDYKVNQIVADSDEQHGEVIKSYHETSGHGTSKTMQFLMKDKYKWDGMEKEIETYVNECLICKKIGGKRRNTEHRVIETSGPGELWQCDLIGRLPTKDGENKFIFVAIDHFDKWIEAQVISEKSQENIIKCVKELIIRKHGIPRRILSDRGREFYNSLCKELAAKEGFVWDYNAVGHHESMGCVERANQTLLRKIMKLSNFGANRWESAVRKAVFACNISPNRAIGTSPYLLRRGISPVIPIDIKLGKHQVTINKEELLIIRSKTKENYNDEIVKGKIKIKEEFECDQAVLIMRDMPRAKLESKWEEGYTIVGKAGNDSYVVSNGKSKLTLNKAHIKKRFVNEILVKEVLD
ncbi:hypothetical protein ENBRE01_0423 [Enteropsectra breve]|nr:hypothetical protein ENBRE01_0423 [Enteropsectra breve]